MYLLCYGRSPKAKKTGEYLMDCLGGRWIENAEFFSSRIPLAAAEKNACIVMLLPLEACCGILSDNYSPTIASLPVVCVSPDKKFAAVVKRADETNLVDTDAVYSAIAKLLGPECFTEFGNTADFAPDLTAAAHSYNMSANDPELLIKINEHIKGGGRVSIYTDLPLTFSEPVLDALIFDINRYGPRTSQSFAQAYISEKKSPSEQPSVFITCASFPEVEGPGTPLVLTPRMVSVGLEIKSKVDPEYAAEFVKTTLEKHGISTGAVSTVAVAQSVRESEIVHAVADSLGASVTAFSSKQLSEAVIPLQMTFSPDRSSEMCTAAACLASVDGKILLRKSGGTSGLLFTAALNKGNIMMTE